jgi:predicted HicB family RNase H-like nuclease
MVSDEYVDAAVEDAVRKARRRGRPSLSQSGESPLLRVRVSPELDAAVSRAAEASGETRADWIRHALSKAARKAG